MIREIKVPSPGESITEVAIEVWLKNDGDFVERDEHIADIQSDKAVLTLYAEEAGRLKILVAAGETIKVGTVVCSIDTSAAPAAAAAPNGKAAEPAKAAATSPAVKAEPAPAGAGYAQGVPSPSADKLAKDTNVPLAEVAGTGRDGRITKADVLAYTPAAAAPPVEKAAAAPPPAPVTPTFTGERTITRVKLTQLRKTLAARLVAVKNQTAMLTTFNEADMTAILDLRKRYKDKFQEKHGVSLGFMSFFTKAVCEAAKSFPNVNAQIDGEELVEFSYIDVSVAVSTDRGLVTPVVRNAERLSLAQIEAEIGNLAQKARANRLTIPEMMGGTFTITNGGVFGSLMSTPIINPPQSAILGMHKIQERPVALNGQVVVRPMMYLALSYDHRIIDGRESVGFLVKVKECLEDPLRLLLEV